MSCVRGECIIISVILSMYGIIRSYIYAMNARLYVIYQDVSMLNKSV